MNDARKLSDAVKELRQARENLEDAKELAAHAMREFRDDPSEGNAEALIVSLRSVRPYEKELQRCFERFDWVRGELGLEVSL